jgi:hypothetical protein
LVTISSVGEVATWTTGTTFASVGCSVFFASGSSGTPPVSGSPDFASRICL